jgi:cardiolipin synthase
VRCGRAGDPIGALFYVPQRRAPSAARAWVLLIVDRTANTPLVQLAQQSFYDDLRAAGVRIHPYCGNFPPAKHMSVDDERVLIGSSNLDLRSFRLNADVSVLIDDRGVAASLARIQERYLARSESVDSRARAARGRGRRWMENLARLTDALH